MAVKHARKRPHVRLRHWRDSGEVCAAHTSLNFCSRTHSLICNQVSIGARLDIDFVGYHKQFPQKGVVSLKKPIASGCFSLQGGRRGLADLLLPYPFGAEKSARRVSGWSH